MSVYNAEASVAPALDSVLGQSVTDIDVIVVNDGSTDRTAAILAGYADPRMRVVDQSRRGLTRSLNRALRLAVAPLVARMDGDDIALPERFARQLAFLQKHPEVGLLGTGCQEIAESGQVVRTIRPPTAHEDIQRTLIRQNPFIHSSVIMRRSAVEALGGYDETLPVAQDYDLWMRMSGLTRLADLDEVLILRRLVSGRVTAVHDGERLRAEARIRWSAVRRGEYPWWCFVFAARPALALMVPASLRGMLRRRRRR